MLDAMMVEIDGDAVGCMMDNAVCVPTPARKGNNKAMLNPLRYQNYALYQNLNQNLYLSLFQKAVPTAASVRFAGTLQLFARAACLFGSVLVPAMGYAHAISNTELNTVSSPTISPATVSADMPSNSGAPNTPSMSSPANSIHWATNPSPPFHINHGPYQQQGVCDVLIDAVHRQLPQYQRQQTELPQDRISRALSEGEPMCFPCMIYRSSMRGTVLFSKPTHVYRPHQIITTSSMAGQILQRTGQPVHLPTLLRQPDLVFGYPQGRRYGVLQADIDQYGRAVTRPGFDGSMAVLEMIATGRLSYTIDYDIVKNYYNQLHKLNLTAEHLQQPLPAAPSSGALVIAGRDSSSGDVLLNHRPNMAMVGIPIASRLDEPVWGAIGCPNNAWGRARIADINRNITAIRQDPAFYQTLLRWNTTDEQQNYAAYWARWVDYLDPVLKEIPQQPDR